MSSKNKYTIQIVILIFIFGGMALNQHMTESYGSWFFVYVLITFLCIVFLLYEVLRTK